VSFVAPTTRRTGALLPLDPPRDQWSGDGTTQTVTRTRIIAYDRSGGTWRASIPSIGTAHPNYAWMKFRSYSLRERSGGTAELQLNYVQDGQPVGGDPPPLPPDQTSEQNAALEIDIRQHPKWETVNSAWGGKSMSEFWDPVSESFPAVEPEGGWPSGDPTPADLRGLRSYIVGSFQVVITTYSFTQPASVSGFVGRRAVPAGQSGSADNWLIISGNRQNLGGYWSRSLVYQYTERGLATFLYATT
jgi:hypothetical protein